ncbi:hypothetical protein PAMP_010454 [Pampus punctatissimus]
MYVTSGRLFTGLTRAAVSRGIFLNDVTTTARLNSVRSLTLSCQKPATSERRSHTEEVNNEPITFSTSKASHRMWKVKRSMGSQFKRRGRNVLPISLLGTIFLLWCVLRGETDTDGRLEKMLDHHLPGLFSDEDEEEEEQVEDEKS